MKEAIIGYGGTTVGYAIVMALFGPLIASIVGIIVIMSILAFLYHAGRPDNPA